MSVLAPDVLWLEILQTLRFYREGSLWHKRRMRHTASMKDCEIPHGNMDFVTDPISEPVISPVIPLY